MKRYAILLILVAVALAFGCGRGPDEEQVQTPADTASVDQPQDEIADVPDDAEDRPLDSTEAPAIAEGAVVLVNGRPISRAEYEESLANLMQQYRQFYAQYGQNLDQFLQGADGSLLSLRLQAETVRGIARLELLEEEAEARGIEVSEEAIEERFAEDLQSFLDQYGMTEEDLIEELEAQGTDYESFVEAAQSNTAIQLRTERLRDNVLGDVEISDEALQTYFEANRTAYETPEQVRASHILVESEVGVQSASERLDAGESFASIAEDLSIDTGSAVQGGDLGFFERGRMVPAFEEAAFGLEIGEMSEPVETQFGYHIILVTDRREAASPTLEEIEDEVREDALEEERTAQFQTWFSGIEENAEIDVLLPLVAASQRRDEDLDAGLEAFEALVDDEAVNEPYLQFYIGDIYETKMRMALEEQAVLEAGEEISDEDAARIEQLGNDAETYRLAAIDAYELALAEIGVDAGLEGRLERLRGDDEETQDDAGPETGEQDGTGGE
jgi:foldase protein PrsA